MAPLDMTHLRARRSVRGNVQSYSDAKTLVPFLTKIFIVYIIFEQINRHVKFIHFYILFPGNHEVMS